MAKVIFDVDLKPEHFSINPVTGKLELNPAAIGLTDGDGNVLTDVAGVALRLEQDRGPTASNPPLAFDPATQLLTYTTLTGETVPVDLSSFVASLSGSFDSAALTLTLTDEDGNAETVALGDLTRTETSNSNSITLSGTGQAAAPLSAEINLNASDTNNLLAESASGVTASGYIQLTGLDGTLYNYQAIAGNAP